MLQCVSNNETSYNSSFLLALLSCWCITIRHEFQVVAHQAGLFSTLKLMLEAYRKYLNPPFQSLEAQQAYPIVDRLSHSINWHLGRKTLSSIVAPPRLHQPLPRKSQ